jgi:histidine kinase/DNA gyrase B/HSP90-like ATPase
MTHDVVVQVQHDHLARLATARSPVAAIAEMIWNSFDADAANVEVLVVPNMLGGVQEVRISDDGSGMAPHHAAEAFGSLGSSDKRRRARTPGGRLLHGRLGKGRFRAFAIGTEVQWHTTFADEGAFYSFDVIGTRDQLRVFHVSDPVDAVSPHTGTVVSITDVHVSLQGLTSSRAFEDLTSEFALYLLQYPNVRLTYNRERVTPDREIARAEDLALTPFRTDAGEEVGGTLTVIEWARDVERAIFLCDAAGVTLGRTNIGIHAPGFMFTAYLKSDLIRSAEDRGVLDLEALSPELGSLIDNGRQELRGYFRRRKAEEASTLVEEWKRQEVYPYKEPPKDPVEQAEQQVFDVLAQHVQAYLPTFEGADAPSKRLTFRLLRQALESDAPALRRILQDVLGLPAEKQEELAKLLERTTLAAIITASKVVADRLDFLSGLQVLLFEPETRESLLERRQLHRIVADQTWIFGEEFNLAVDDQSLTEVLKVHCEGLGIEVLDSSPVLREDGSRGIVDLMLTRAIPQPRAQNREHLVVELKRPNVSIGQTELGQVTSYAEAVARDERFRHTNTSWEFWAVSNELSDTVVRLTHQANRPEGLYAEWPEDRTRIWVKSWGQILRECEGRLRFFQERLEYRADRAGAVEYLREMHAKYLPESLAASANSTDQGQGGV